MRQSELLVVAGLLSAPFIVNTTAAACPSGVMAARDDTPVAEPLAAAWRIEEVTLYQGRAMVSRVANSPAREGLFELRFDGIPPSADAATLQATVQNTASGERGGAKLLDVRFEETVTRSDVTNNPELKQSLALLEDSIRRGEVLGMQMAAVNDRYTLLTAIRQKTATESAKDFGSKSLDPEALGRQIAFLDATQAQLIADRAKLDGEIRANADERGALQAKVNALGGQSRIERTAIVTVGQSVAQSATVTLRYLTVNAGWSPRYAVRADVDAGKLAVEYDAEIRQATGEDWNDVRLTLSTAQPTQKAAPDALPPVFVDVFVPPPVVASMGLAMAPKSALRATGGDPGSPSGGMDAPAPMENAAPESAMNMAYKLAFADAGAMQTGTVVSYPLPRAISIPSDAQRSRKQRIATVDTKPSFVHVARPLVESAVYLKAVAANGSAFQFLAGPATVFLGGDSVGSTTLPDLAPGAEMTFWLGTDRRIEVKRAIVRKETLERGVFDKADETTWQYRIDLASTDTKPVTVELVDRMPVSRNEQIKIALKDPSQPLDGDKRFVDDDKPQGILKWTVSLPARSGDGKPAQKSVSWTVVMTKSKDTRTTGLPE